jgi:hypothetical protein
MHQTRTKGATRILYALQYSMRVCRSRPFSLLLRVGAGLRGVRSSNGIVVYDIHPATRHTSAFHERMDDVIELVRSQDAIAWRLLKRRIHLLLNMPLSSPVRLHLCEQECDIDITRWPFEKHQDWSRLHCAAVLVFSAAYFRCWDNGIPMTSSTRPRIGLAALRRAEAFAASFEDRDFDWIGYFERQRQLAVKGDPVLVPDRS